MKPAIALLKKKTTIRSKIYLINDGGSQKKVLESGCPAVAEAVMVDTIHGKGDSPA